MNGAEDVRRQLRGKIYTLALYDNETAGVIKSEETQKIIYTVEKVKINFGENGLPQANDENGLDYYKKLYKIFTSEQCMQTSCANKGKPLSREQAKAYIHKIANNGMYATKDASTGTIIGFQSMRDINLKYNNKPISESLTFLLPEQLQKGHGGIFIDTFFNYFSKNNIIVFDVSEHNRRTKNIICSKHIPSILHLYYDKETGFAKCIYTISMELLQLIKEPIAELKKLRDSIMDAIIKEFMTKLEDKGLERLSSSHSNQDKKPTEEEGGSFDIGNISGEPNSRVDVGPKGPKASQIPQQLQQLPPNFPSPKL